MANLLFNSGVYFTIYRDTLGFWRWRAKSWNHEIIASGEAYHNKADCLRAISLMKGSGDGPVNEE